MSHVEVKSGSHTAGVSGKVVDAIRRINKSDVALSQLSLRVQAAFQMTSGADVFGKVRRRGASAQLCPACSSRKVAQTHCVADQVERTSNFGYSVCDISVRVR